MDKEPQDGSQPEAETPVASGTAALQGRPRRKKRRLAVRLLIVAACIAAFFGLLLLLLPFIITHIPLPELRFDLSDCFGEGTADIASNKTLTVKMKVSRGEPDGFRIRAKGRLLDWAYTANAYVRFGFFRADGEAELSIDGTDWKAESSFGIASSKDWRFKVAVGETKISHDGAVIGDLLGRVAPAVAQKLLFTGVLSVDAEGECTPQMPVPALSVRGSLKDVSAVYVMDDGALDVDNFRVRFGAQGAAGRMEISPLFPRADSVMASGVVLSNVFASIRATERSYLVTEAGAEFCGGDVRLYAMFLDMERLNAGATIFADGIDAGQALSLLSGFSGDASGKLHGKLPFYVRGGSELHFKNAYLYSTPGETGKIKISDSRPLLDKLEAGGVPEEDRENLAKVLANLNYRSLRVELNRGETDLESTLNLRLDGEAKQNKTKVPVNINVTLRGELETLLNAGIGIQRRK